MQKNGLAFNPGPALPPWADGSPWTLFYPFISLRVLHLIFLYKGFFSLWVSWQQTIQILMIL